MRVGIIAEGPSDIAVVQSILKGAIDLDTEFTTPLRPELAEDETDLADPSRGFSNWEYVKCECEDGAKIDAFLQSPIDDGLRFVVIHIDAAEAHLYGVDRPPQADDGVGLRAMIRATIHGWLADRSGVACCAIAVEETDAWILALHSDIPADHFPNVKERLNRYLAKTLRKREAARLRGGAYSRAWELSRALRRRKGLARCCARSPSLRAFVAELWERASQD